MTLFIHTILTDCSPWGDVEIGYRYTAGRVANRFNGWPAEEPEVEFVSAKARFPSEDWADDEIVPTSDEVVDWAAEWIERGNGFDYACEAAVTT